MPRPRPFSGKGKRQRFYARTAVKTTLYPDAGAIDAIKNCFRAGPFCKRLMRQHAGASQRIWGVRALLVIAGTLCRTNCSKKQRPTGRSGIPAPGRPPLGRKAEIPLPRVNGCSASGYLRKISGAPGAVRSGVPAKVLVFMQLFRSPPHYVMRCGPIDLVTTSPWRLG